eukprot:948113-Ditylum_brightwellii.AAC.1
MDILENVVPKSWQGKMCKQRFDYTAKGQAKLSSFTYVWSCWTHQSKARKANRMPRQQLAIGSKSQERKEAKRPMQLA